MAKKVAAVKRENKVRLTDEEQVSNYMAALQHPMKKEMEALRKIIKSVHPGIKERIKWNAPSYYYIEDMVTFGPARGDHLLLVFHHPHVEKIKSPLLEGEYKGRRLTHFKTRVEIKTNQKELERIVSELVKVIDKNQK